MTSAGIFTLVTPDLRLEARPTAWDAECFGFGVAQIDVLECHRSGLGVAVLRPFYAWLSQNDIRLVSCRLPYDRLHESMLLEAGGFRFIETVLHPYLDLPEARYRDQDTLAIALAGEADVPALEAIAARAFVHGRIHADPRLGAELGDRRYGRWVRSSLAHPTQRLLKIADTDGAIVGLFIVEPGSDQSVYWHLTAIAPGFQGRGYGWRAWRAMLVRHAGEGMRSVRTTITAGNVPVLNLYSRLGFRFLPPENTFHWIWSPEA